MPSVPCQWRPAKSQRKKRKKGHPFYFPFYFEREKNREKRTPERKKRKSARSAEALCDLLDDLPQSDPWSVYQVHDLIDLLEFGLRKVLGDLKPSKGSVDIGALLRQAHDQSKLRASQLDHAIRAWELRNPPYQVLPATRPL
jgi:hypothetical protein